MLYGIQLTLLDLLWAIFTLAAVVAFGLSVRFVWIRGGVLVTFLSIKLMMGLSFSAYSVLTDVEFDAAGYYNTSAPYTIMLREMVAGDSMDYARNTPFWWTDGISTDRFTSLTSLFLLLTGGSFLGATAIACLLGAIGQLLLFRFFRERFPEVRAVYFLPVLFHPSLMLWSGMLLKDSLGIFALGGAVYSLYRLIAARQLASLVSLAGNIYIIMLFRSFIFLPLAAFVLFMVWDRVVLPYAQRQTGGGIVKILYFMGAAGLCILLLWILVSRLGSGLIEDRREGAAIYSQIEAGSTFENVDLSFSFNGILAISVGTLNSLFRPFPWDVVKPVQAAAALENLVVLGYAWLGFYCYLRRLTSRQREHFAGMFWGMLVVALIIATGVGLFASNSGTISRYRIPMIPFLVAVPGLALGMADSFRKGGQRFTGTNLRQRFQRPEH